MATEEKIVYSVELKGDKAGKSLSDLKKEFKETEKELSNLTAGTKEYVAQLQKLGSLKDDIGDLNNEIKAFNPEGKIKAVGDVVGGLASGFAAAQGAMALFGTENKELEKSLLKVQSAMALSQGIQGIMGMSDSFTKLGNVLKGTAAGTKLVTAAQWLWNAAVNANPIMLLVTAIAALIGALKLYAAASDDAAEKQVRMNELQKEATQRTDEYVASIEKKNKVLMSSMAFELELMKKQGATATELHNKEIAMLEERRKQLKYIEGYRGALTAAEAAELLEITQKKILLNLDYAKAVQTSLETEVEKNRKANEKKREEDLKTYNAKAELLNREIDEEEARELKRKERLAQYNLEADQINAEADAYDEQKRQDKIAREDEERRYKLEQDKAAFDQTFATAQATNDSMMQLSNLLFDLKRQNLEKGSARELAVAKKQFQINKALAITSNIISTIVGVTNALSAQSVIPDPFGTILKVANAAAVGISGTVATAKIASQKFNEGGSGGGGGSLPALPTPNIAPPTQGSTQLNSDGTIKQTPQAKDNVIKAVVVETDITKTQKRVGSIEANAKL